MHINKVDNDWILNIKKIARTDIVSRDHGRRIRKIIEKHLKTPHDLVLDFSNLSIASVSFIDEAFARLFLKFEPDELTSRLRFVNITAFDKALLNDLSLTRIRERQALMKNSKGRHQLAVKLRR